MLSLIDLDPAFTNDVRLIQQIAQRNQGALSALYDRYARILLGTAYKVLNSVEEAEEVVLDVFNQVWRLAERYDACRGRVDTWLFMLTRSRSLDRLRILQRAAKTIAASEHAVLLQPSPPTTNPEESLLMAERRHLLLSAIEQIPVEQRQVIELAYFRGLTCNEIASQIGKPAGTIKTRLRLGLNKLKQVLRNHPVAALD